MGLCKCPKRRVTTQFCFEHRVNVCEHCLLASHPKCVVQSYIQWLQDSDYNPICELCNDVLNKKECLRLVCYHVYHWSCLESMYRSLPRTTAPAGYQCPSCHSGLFPPSNLVSPIADVLREKLSGVNWARAGLGLPLLSDDNETKLNSHNNSDSHFGHNGHILSSNSSYSSGYSGQNDSINAPTPQRVTPLGASDDESNSLKRGSQYSIQVQDDSNYDSTFGSRADAYQGNQMTRKVSENQKRPPNSSFDHDEDKYKRKSAVEWIVRWWKNALPPAQKRRTAAGFFSKRNMMTFILIVIIFTTLVALLMKIGRASIENDPSFNPHSNLNVRVQKE